MNQEKQGQMGRILSMYDRLKNGESLVKRKRQIDLKLVKSRFNVILKVFELISKKKSKMSIWNLTELKRLTYLKQVNQIG